VNTRLSDEDEQTEAAAEKRSAFIIEIHHNLKHLDKNSFTEQLDLFLEIYLYTS